MRIVAGVIAVLGFSALSAAHPPYRLAVDAGGGIVVAETNGRRIWVVDGRGAIGLHPFSRAPDDGFGVVQDLAFGPRGRLFLMRRQETRGAPDRFRLQRLEEGRVTTVTEFPVGDPGRARGRATFERIAAESAKRFDLLRDTGFAPGDDVRRAVEQGCEDVRWRRRAPR